MSSVVVTAVEHVHGGDDCLHFRVLNSNGTSEDIALYTTNRGIVGWSKLERLCAKLGIDVPDDTSQLVGHSYKEIA